MIASFSLNEFGVSQNFLEVFFDPRLRMDTTEGKGRQECVHRCEFCIHMDRCMNES